MPLKRHRWTRDDIGQLRIAAITFFVSLLLIMLFIIVEHGYGDAEIVTGIITHRKTRWPEFPGRCDIYIVHDKTDLLHTTSKQKFCGFDFAPGNTVKFEYKKNIFGKMVLYPLSSIEPVPLPDPSLRVPFVLNPESRTFIESSHQGSGANRP